MTTSRREFLKKSAFALAGTSFLAACATATKEATATRLLGLQLYCVRDEMGTDPLGTLKELAKFGYQNVEHAWYRERKFYGWTPQEFKKILDDLGMKMPAAIPCWHPNIGTKPLTILPMYGNTPLKMPLTWGSNL